jgi:hypothetical protein
LPAYNAYNNTGRHLFDSTNYTVPDIADLMLQSFITTRYFISNTK